jgi:ribosomal protein L37AE/L43A
MDINKIASDCIKTALYHRNKGRVYRRTRKECDSDIVECAKCKSEMELHPYTKSIGIWICPDCGFKISTDKVIDDLGND